MEVTTWSNNIDHCDFPELWLFKGPCYSQYWNTNIIHILFYCEQLERSLHISEPVLWWLGENLKDLEDILYLGKQNILETQLFYLLNSVGEPLHMYWIISECNIVRDKLFWRIFLKSFQIFEDKNVKLSLCLSN
jgi:hypothetical protein